jgi:K+-sensing histidine kinase KdpD
VKDGADLVVGVVETHGRKETEALLDGLEVLPRRSMLAVTAMGRARTTESFYAFGRKLAGAGTLDDVLWASAYQAALMLKVRVVLLLPENGSITVKAGYPPEDILDEADLATAKWAWDHNRAAGRGSDTLPGAKRLFLPMRTGRGVVGVVGIDSDKPGPLLTPEADRLRAAMLTSISHDLNSMGGSITGANLSDRQGAVFTITLPIPKPTEQLNTAA